MLTKLDKEFYVGDRGYKLNISVYRESSEIYIQILNFESPVFPKAHIFIRRLADARWHVSEFAANGSASTYITHHCETYLEMKQSTIKLLINGKI